MYFLDSLSYPLKSEKALEKILIGLALTLIPIVNTLGGIVLLGYGIKIMGHVLSGDENLPEFDLGEDFVRGLFGLLGAFLYVFPPAILGIVVMIALTGATESFSLIGFLLMMVLILVATLVMVVAYARFAVEEDTGALFDVGGNLRLVGSNLNAGGLLLINMFVFGLIAGLLVMVGFLLFFIPGMILAVVVQYAQYHLYTFYARELGIGGKRKVKRVYDADEYAF